MNTTTKSGLRVKTGVKAGGPWSKNHNSSPVRAVKVGLLVKTSIKAGGPWSKNHNACPVRA